MGKLVVSLDGVVIKEVPLTKDTTSLGRRPYNDIVIDNLAVSGEHAVLQVMGDEVFIEDLHSTNGTYVNGKVARKQLLQHNDLVEIGKYKIKYLSEDPDEFERTMIVRHGSPMPERLSAPPAAATQPAPLGTVIRPAPAPLAARPTAPSPATPAPSVVPPSVPPAAAAATIKVLNGAAAGREVPLVKVVTTVGKPGVQVASITRRPGGYVFAHVEGAGRPAVNGQPWLGEPVHLRHGDLIELAGTQMQFSQP